MQNEPGRLLAMLLFAGAMTGQAMAEDPAPAVDLKLFDKADVDRSKGCSLVLWQEDRDPDKDRFAYAFVETVGPNHAREKSRIRVGNEVLTFRRVAVGGGKEFGYKTFPYQLYKADKDSSYIILDLKVEDSPGEVVDITDGTMMVVRPRLPRFTIGVKGNAGCNTPAATAAPAKVVAAPAPVPANQGSPTGIFEKIAVAPALLPAAIKRAAKQKLECTDKAMARPFSGYQMSEESALWEIPCNEYATGMGFAYALVYLPDPGKQFEFKGFKAPDGKERMGNAALLVNPVWDLKARTVTATWLEGNNDCGTFERFRVTPEGGFQLMEFREQTMCGRKVPVKDFPLVYRR